MPRELTWRMIEEEMTDSWLEPEKLFIISEEHTESTHTHHQIFGKLDAFDVKFNAIN